MSCQGFITMGLLGHLIISKVRHFEGERNGLQPYRSRRAEYEKPLLTLLTYSVKIPTLMGTIFSDIWALAAGAGLLISLGALPFLFKRARAASAGPLPSVMAPPVSGLDALDDEPIPVVKAVPAAEAEEPKPVAKPEPRNEKPASEAEKPAPQAEKAAVPASEMTMQAGADLQQTAKKAEKGPTTGGISPAVVYLQNLKIQMEHFEKEIHQLRTQMLAYTQTHDKEFKLLLDKLGELQSGIQGRPAPAAAPAPAPKAAPAPAPKVVAAPKPAPAPAPAPKPAPAPEPKPAPAPAPKPAPVAEPKPEPKVESSEQPTIQIELGARPAPGMTKTAAKPAPEPKPEPKAAPAPAPATEPTLAVAPPPADEKTVVIPPPAKKAEPETAEQIAAGLSLKFPGGEPLVPPAEEEPNPGAKGPVWPV